MAVFVFDIETVPDTQAGTSLFDWDLDASQTAQALFNWRRQETGRDFLPHFLQKIVAISGVLKHQDKIKVWSLGTEGSTEAELIERFFDGIERFQPTLITWNGGGFDLPVLHYRALFHGIACPRYWEVGEEDQSFRWNNYLNRFHYRHMDLMDILSGYQTKAVARLDDIACLLGLPGKMGMHGSKVWEYYQNNQIAAIRDYCETDVLNTYLVYLRLELIRGKLSKAQYEHECELLRQYLANEDKTHFTAFLNQWQKNNHE